MGKFLLKSGDYTVRLCTDCVSELYCKSIALQGDEIASEYPNAPTVYSKCDLSAVTDADFEAMSGLKIPVEKGIPPYTMETPLKDFVKTFWGRLVYGIIVGRTKKLERRAKKEKEGPLRDNLLKGAKFMKVMYCNNCLASMSSASSGLLPYNLARALLALANGKPFSFIGHALSFIKAPPLPKNKRKK